MLFMEIRDEMDGLENLRVLAWEQWKNVPRCLVSRLNKTKLKKTLHWIRTSRSNRLELYNPSKRNICYTSQLRQ